MTRNMIRPDEWKKDTECEQCKDKGHSFFTNKEIHNNGYIQQWCVKCDRFTIWRIKK